MTSQLTELHSYPKWIDTLTTEQRHEWYLRIKESLPIWRELGDSEELEKAVIEYEHRHGIL